MERAISGLPRRCEADAWEEEQRGLYRARRSVTISSSGFAHEPCCHSKNNKPLAKGKLGPAAEGNPPRGNNFRVREFVLQRKTNSVRKFRRKSFPSENLRGEFFYSFRPFGAPPSEREAREENAATPSKREAREGRSHKRGQGRRGKIAAAPRVIQVWFRAQASASRSSALTKASLPSQYASMS